MHNQIGLSLNQGMQSPGIGRWVLEESLKEVLEQVACQEDNCLGKRLDVFSDY